MSKINAEKIFTMSRDGDPDPHLIRFHLVAESGSEEYDCRSATLQVGVFYQDKI